MLDFVERHNLVLPVTSCRAVHSDKLKRSSHRDGCYQDRMYLTSDTPEGPSRRPGTAVRLTTMRTLVLFKTSRDLSVPATQAMTVDLLFPPVSLLQQVRVRSLQASWRAFKSAMTSCLKLSRRTRCRARKNQVRSS